MFHFRPQAQQMADGEDEVGAVHRIEMEGGHPAVDQIEHLLGGDRGVTTFHFYTMNRADLVYAICHLLGLRPATQEAA